VPDGVGRHVLVHRPCLAVVDEVSLQAGRACVDGQNWFQDGASSSGCDGRCEARTQGAFVCGAIRARLRTPPRAVQRGPTAQRLILKPVL
jgi:hypothetical protein